MAKGYSSFQERWRENYTYQIKDRMKVGEDTLGIMSIPDQNYSHKKQVNAWAREGLKRITKPMKCYRYRWFKTNTVWGLGPIFNKGFWQSGEDKETKLSESWSDKDYQVSLCLPEMKTKVHYLSTFKGRKQWTVTQVFVLALKSLPRTVMKQIKWKKGKRGWEERRDEGRSNTNKFEQASA